MKFVVNDRLVLSRAPEGPFATLLGAFAESLSQQGYVRRYVHRQVMLAARFSRWLKQTGVLPRRIASEHLARFLRARYRRRRPNQGDIAALDHFLEFLRREKVVPAEKKPLRRPAPAQHQAQAYEQYLRQVRGLAEVTIQNYVSFIRTFLEDRFGDRPVRLARLCARDVAKFVQLQAQHLHMMRAKLLTTALRSFLQYARYRGDIELDLAAAVPAVAAWRMASIPRGIATDHVRQLLASVDRRSATGRRDYAILLLLARLGLRSSEVAFIELDDIDWNAGELSVRGKGGQRCGLPLPAEVGRAIAAYLRSGRPHSSSRRVFLRARAPIGGFQGASGIGSIVRHRLERAGIEATTYGTHQFRHGLATEMLHRGASLAEIGQLLGHRSPETTTIYTKVHLDALRTLALPWPGGVR